MKFIVRLLVSAAALGVAAFFVRGITVGSPASLLFAALIFGFVNALIRPLLTLISCPVIVLTLGLFTLVINALMLMMTSWFGRHLGIDFVVTGFWPAFWGALIVSVISTLLSWLLADPARGR